ncbi:MAG TPA: DUF58 domain-containing protein [Methanotrichaceae archaeon]|nr:DUF58 domain-containing protein [Methanotrichaceae archaeon]
MDTEFFKDLDKFALSVKKRVSTPYSGGRKSVRFGHGISPVGYREYRKGDDFKLIDWKVYGRTEKLYVREHEEERSLVVQMLLDASASMGYDEKFSFASRIAAGFAYLATLESEKFSVSIFSEEMVPADPRSGRKNLFRTIAELDETVPEGKTNIKLVSDQFDQMARSTSLVILISDFLDDTEQVKSSIYRLSAHDLMVIQVLAPDEADLNLGGDIKFVDMESGHPLITRVSERVRKDYRSRLESHNDSIAAACNSVGADFFSFRTDKPMIDVFMEINSRAQVWRA